MAEDPHIQQSEQAEIDADRAAKAANLFDLRRIIGGLFVIYGVILTVLGLGESDASIEKSAGVNVNLYAGLAMLAVAACCSSPGRCCGRCRRRWTQTRSRAAGPGATTTAPSGRGQPTGSSASTAPPKPPPIMRAPAAPACLSRSTVASTSGTDAS